MAIDKQLQKEDTLRRFVRGDSAFFSTKGMLVKLFIA
jgi:hypothetical protein